MTQFACIVALIMLLTGCSEKVPSPEDFSGCHELTIQTYDSVPAWLVAGYVIGADSTFEFIPPPAVIQVDTTPANVRMYEDTPWLVRPLVHRPSHVYFPAAWGVVEGDSIQLAWSDGFIGTAIRVPLGGKDLLRGRAEQITDDPGSPDTALAVLRRVDCPD
jgi:hypothetical protein